MRWPGLANPRARRFRFDRLTPAALAKIARSPSYRAPRAADLHDPDTFQPPAPPRMSGAERGLLDAVLADPDADAPRLAYADWAERQGDLPRARFIRSAVGAAQRGDPGAAPPGPNPAAAAAQRAARTFAPWAATDLVFRRGFVEGMSLSGRAFLSAADPLFRLTPLRDVRLVAVQPFVGELARCPHLARLRRLDLAGNRIGPAGIRDLVGSPRLGTLDELGLAGNALGHAGATALAAAPWLSGLNDLDLADNLLGPNDLERLLAATGPGLVALDVPRNPLGPAGGTVLSRWPGLAGLRRVNLARCELGGDGAEQLFRAGQFPNARELDLAFNDIGTPGAAALAGNASLAGLASVGLGFNDIGDPGLGAVAAAGALRGLVALDLTGNRLTAAGATALAAATFGTLETLTLAGNPLGDDGAVALVRGDGLGGLRHLDVSNCGVTDDGVRRLVAAGAVGGLEALSLAWNPLGDAGAKALAGCPDLAGLRELDLTGSRLGFAGAVALADSPHLGGLRGLTLGENPRLPADARGLLADRFGTITA